MITSTHCSDGVHDDQTHCSAGVPMYSVFDHRYTSTVVLVLMISTPHCSVVLIISTPSL